MDGDSACPNLYGKTEHTKREHDDPFPERDSNPRSSCPSALDRAVPVIDYCYYYCVAVLSFGCPCGALLWCLTVRICISWSSRVARSGIFSQLSFTTAFGIDDMHSFTVAFIRSFECTLQEPSLK